MDSGISKFDLTAEFTESGEGLAGSIEYSTALYKPETIARMVERMIGMKPGTGGSEGVGYLRTTLGRKFFPDLWAVRTSIGGSAYGS